jgi:ribosomal-protein-alanine N-acetyltransferase
MSFRVRPASHRDVPLIVAIEKATPTAAHWPVSEYEKLLEGGILLVVEHGSEIMGFVCAREIAGEAELENIAVSEPQRRSGIADSLMRALIDQAAARGIVRIFLEVRELNRPARFLYNNHGFREVGKRLAYYQHPSDDAVIYELRLPPVGKQTGSRSPSNL